MNLPSELSGKLIRIEEVLAFVVGDCYLGKREAAAFLSVSVRTLEGLQGLRRYRLNKAVRYRRRELDAWMQAHAEAARQPVEKRGGLRKTMEASKRRALAEETNDLTGGREE
jgi:hypothetical protein